MCLWWTSRAHLRFWAKSIKIKNGIQTVTRALFPTCSHNCIVQNGAVAWLVVQKCYSHSKIVHRLSGIQPRNSRNQALFRSAKCGSYFCCVLAQCAACKFLFLVAFYSTISLQPHLLIDALIRQDCTRSCRMRRLYTSYNSNFRGHILMKKHSCFLFPGKAG